MTKYTYGYAVEALNERDTVNGWTVIATHYACYETTSPGNSEQFAKAWDLAFARAQALEDAGRKVRIRIVEKTNRVTTVWKGR